MKTVVLDVSPSRTPDAPDGGARHSPGYAGKRQPKWDHRDAVRRAPTSPQRVAPQPRNMEYVSPPVIGRKRQGSEFSSNPRIPQLDRYVRKR